MSPAEQDIRRLVGEGFARISDAVTKLSRVAPEEPNLPVYIGGLERLKAEWSRVDDAFFADKARVTRFLAKIPPFADQVRATTEKNNVSFWDGFWENLGRRYTEMIAALPSPRELISAARWIVPALAVLAVVVIFGPEIKAALAARRGK